MYTYHDIHELAVAVSTAFKRSSRTNPTITGCFLSITAAARFEGWQKTGEGTQAQPQPQAGFLATKKRVPEDYGPYVL